MSLRAELIRLCLPWFMRPRFPPDVHIGDVRRRMMRFAHLIPHPPRGTEVIAVEAGGVALALHERGVFTWPEWAAALEEIRAAKAAGDPDLGTTYYCYWLAALEKLVASKDIASREALTRYRDA